MLDTSYHNCLEIDLNPKLHPYPAKLDQQMEDQVDLSLGAVHLHVMTPQGHHTLHQGLLHLDTH